MTRRRFAVYAGPRKFDSRPRMPTSPKGSTKPRSSRARTAASDADARVPLPARDSALIASFLERSWSELGLADNTLASYRLDLEGFARWLQSRGRSLEQCGRADLQQHLAERGLHGGARGNGYSARSNARLLSSLRHFYRGLVRDGASATIRHCWSSAEAAAQPAQGLVGARSREPAACAAGYADRLARSRDARTHVCHRPARSELVGITASQVNLRQGVLRVVGKGGKERLVPLGDEAAIG